MNQQFDTLYKSLLKNGTLLEDNDKKTDIKANKDIQIRLIDIKSQNAKSFNFGNVKMVIDKLKTGVNIFKLTDLNGAKGAKDSSIIFKILYYNILRWCKY